MAELSNASLETLFIISVNPDPVVSAPEIAAELDISPQAVNKRLKTVESSGFVKSKEVGASAKVYWLTESGKEVVSSESLKWL